MILSMTPRHLQRLHRPQPQSQRGRRDGKRFVLDHDAIMKKYGARIKMAQRVPKALSGAMADMMYLCNCSSEAERDEYYASLLAEC